MLVEMLKKNRTFTQLPLPKQEILARLATEFESDFRYLYLSPEELQEETQVGNKNQWTELLNLDVTSAYIKQQMGQQIQVAQRKAVLALTSEAMRGNTQASKQITELAGILNQADSNKIVVLHKIDRPEVKREEPKNA